MKIVKQLDKYKIHIAALQEVIWKESGRINQNNLTMLYSGGEKQ